MFSNRILFFSIICCFTTTAAIIWNQSLPSVKTDLLSSDGGVFSPRPSTGNIQINIPSYSHGLLKIKNLKKFLTDNNYLYRHEIANIEKDITALQKNKIAPFQNKKIKSIIESLNFQSEEIAKSKTVKRQQILTHLKNIQHDLAHIHGTKSSNKTLKRIFFRTNQQTKDQLLSEWKAQTKSISNEVKTIKRNGFILLSLLMMIGMIALFISDKVFKYLRSKETDQEQIDKSNFDDVIQNTLLQLGPSCQNFDFSIKLDVNNQVDLKPIRYPYLIQSSLAELIKGVIIYLKNFGQDNQINISHQNIDGAYIVTLAANNSIFKESSISNPLFYQNLEYTPLAHYLTECEERLTPVASEIKLQNVFQEETNKRGISVEIEMWPN